MRPLLSHLSLLPCVYAGRLFSEGVVFFSQRSQGLIDHLGTRARFPGEA